MTWSEAVSQIHESGKAGAALAAGAQVLRKLGIGASATQTSSTQMDSNLVQASQTAYRQLDRALNAALPTGATDSDLESGLSSVNSAAASSTDRSSYIQNLVTNTVAGLSQQTTAGAVQADQNIGALGTALQQAGATRDTVTQHVATMALTTVMNVAVTSGAAGAAGQANRAAAQLASSARGAGAALSWVAGNVAAIAGAAGAGYVAGAAKQAVSIALDQSFQRATQQADTPGSQVYNAEVRQDAQAANSEEPTNARTSRWTRFGVDERSNGGL